MNGARPRSNGQNRRTSLSFSISARCGATGVTSSTARATKTPKSPKSSTNTLCPSKRSEEHTSELQSRLHLVCRLLLEKKKTRRAVFGRVPAARGDRGRRVEVREGPVPAPRQADDWGGARACCRRLLQCRAPQGSAPL